MSDNSKIQWADTTWNVTAGCTEFCVIACVKTLTSVGNVENLGLDRDKSAGVHPR